MTCSNRESYKEGEKEMGYTDALTRRIVVEEVTVAENKGGGKIIKDKDLGRHGDEEDIAMAERPSNS